MTREEAQFLRKGGMTYQAIADHFGVTRQRIHQVLKLDHTPSYKAKRRAYRREHKAKK